MFRREPDAGEFVPFFRSYLLRGFTPPYTRARRTNQPKSDARRDQARHYAHYFVVLVRQECDRSALLARTAGTSCTQRSDGDVSSCPCSGEEAVNRVPIRCTYASIVFAIWKLTTKLTSVTSIPRPAKSVATRMSASPLRSCAKAASRPSWLLPECSVAALHPARCRSRAT